MLGNGTNGIHFLYKQNLSVIKYFFIFSEYTCHQEFSEYFLSSIAILEIILLIKIPTVSDRMKDQFYLLVEDSY